jgi:hypothetical protein
VRNLVVIAFLLAVCSCYNTSGVKYVQKSPEYDEAYWTTGESFWTSPSTPEKSPVSSDDYYNTAKPVVPYQYRNYYDPSSYSRPYVYIPYQPILVNPAPTISIPKPEITKPSNGRSGPIQTGKITHIKRP